MNSKILNTLKNKLKGELLWDNLTKTIYATDASAYREIPTAVAFPKDTHDIKLLIAFARANNTSLIPRTAGTSLAGQVVGAGIIVDVSRYFTSIIEVDEKAHTVTVQPGVVRDELNMHLKPYGFFFGPETSTANRAMIGGMIGNNSCGSNSVIYGSTRDQIVSINAILSDGSDVVFKSVSKDEFDQKCELKSLEGEIYRNIKSLLSDEENRKRIAKEFPKASIHRRNTGYAIDLLANSQPFIGGDELFDFCKLIAGSEGTLAFITEVKLSVNPLPTKHKSLVCIHFESIYESLKGNLIALEFNPSASELMDHYILECTKDNIEQRHNRFFVEGDPKAVLVVELFADSEEALNEKCNGLISKLKQHNMGYHYPIVTGEDINKVWTLRKAGLGLLSNMPGDAKPVPVIEDTAVDVNDLPEYINDFNKILEKHNLYCVHYAHAGSGELHLRPILDLKTEAGNSMFREILAEIATLVKKYSGSLSGEHGDGRLRGEFIKHMIGDENYRLLVELKNTWDPQHIFNPNKIVDTLPMNTSLRYYPGQVTKDIPTILNFDDTLGYVRAAEQCNGSGDCRKSHLSGGTMCPSYMATKSEKDTTRARANTIREIINISTEDNPLANDDIKEVMDLCLSCKGCKSECPSNVDVGKLKAEFQYQYQVKNGISFRNKIIGNFSKLNKLASKMPWLYKLTMQTPLSIIPKLLIGFHPKRSMPSLSKMTLRKWVKKHQSQFSLIDNKKGEVILFCDEFTNYNDAHVGITAVKLLHKLGYEVKFVDHPESGRSMISKGILAPAKTIANEQVALFHPLVGKNLPLIGLEPSAILTFRDEYPNLVDKDLREKAKVLAYHALTIEEFLAQEVDKGNIQSLQFTNEAKTIKLHGHCHQKALSSLIPSKKILSLPTNFTTQIIPSGCCGMAGSFGYEKEHYDLSMSIGELVLFATVRSIGDDVLIAAAGTSCRHQIKDGTQKTALHPIEILYDALV